jgi:alkylation response protein AidB-like acyl-CoA dehydrogenase
MDILSSCPCFYTNTAIVVFLYFLYKLYQCTNVDTGEMDAATIQLLKKQTTSQSVRKECIPIVEALETAHRIDNEAECAQQMRDIVVSEHLKFSTLIDRPEILLGASKGCQEGINTALWTRFTVTYNLYAGSIVAMGNDNQREELLKSQTGGSLGCFAFTEVGAGVLSGAGVETTAKYDSKSKTFVVHSPTKSSCKNWISQGCFAEFAVILAELFVNDVSHGPHLFWARIANMVNGKVQPLDAVTVGSNLKKTTMLGLDNAKISFNQFRIPAKSLLDRYGAINTSTDTYESKLPKGIDRTIDLLLSRLLTGRIVLSETSLSFTMHRIRHSWEYCQQRELWRGRHPKGRMMSEMTLQKICFRDYSRTTRIIQNFVEHTRERVGDTIRNNSGFTDDLIEATCMCKFLCTGFSVDCLSVIRKTMGARSLQTDALLGEESFMPNATSAAEGDNTVMELKVVQDIVRGRTPKIPFGLIWRTSGTAHGRKAAAIYLSKFARAMLLGKKAIKDGQLLRDIAWARSHLRIIDTWLKTNQEPKEWLESYDRIAMRFPVPMQM